ncbi:MAG: PAS domain-containing protein [Bdellovibrionales bacterium]|nr:PAS domain-containing protein [Bdellovibrionales bacterium]
MKTVHPEKLKFPTPVGILETKKALRDVGIGIWDYNLMTQEISFDENMFALFGFQKTSISSTEWVSRISPLDQERTLRVFRESVKKKVPFDHQFRVVLPEEPAKVIRCTGRIHADVPSRLLGVCIDVTKDVSDRERAQAQSLKDVSISKANALSKLSAGIAHEINNPLTIILGHAENLVFAASKGFVPTGEINKSTGSILNACQRISHIVRGLRNFARDGSHDPVETTNLSDIFEHVLALCRSRFRNHEIDLKVQIPNADVMVFCRATEMEQALFYLLSHAFDTTTEAQEKWVRVTTNDVEAFVEVVITSSQVGISEDIRNQMMNPLLALDIAGDGSLLGLSIAKGIVESVRGSIALDESSNFFRLVIQVPKSPPIEG